MKNQQRPSLLALSALLLCTLQQASLAAAAAAEVIGTNNVGNWLRETNISNGNHSHESRAKLKEVTEHDVNISNTSRGYITTVMSERSPEEGVSAVCAYRVIEGGIGGQLCFRHTLFGYKCHKEDCRTVVSAGGLVANILLNGSVLLQWSHQGESSDPGTNLTKEESPAITVFSGRRHRRSGFELSCWWNGSYTQFECTGVHLGSGCRDYVLSELHENIPYRICVRSLANRAKQRDCVEFTLPPSGMQDIVIAMTTVGGAICVMLVIICLLVAYITENIMSPTTQHTYSYRTHSRH